MSNDTVPPRGASHESGHCWGPKYAGMMLTAFGVVVLTFMMLMYALERRGPVFVLAFAVGCALASLYGFLAGTWPFGGVEAIWAVIALRRYARLRRPEAQPEQPHDGAAESPPREVVATRSEVTADRLQ